MEGYNAGYNAIRAGIAKQMKGEGLAFLFPRLGNDEQLMSSGSGGRRLARYGALQIAGGLKFLERSEDIIFVAGGLAAKGSGFLKRFRDVRTWL